MSTHDASAAPPRAADPPRTPADPPRSAALAADIKRWGAELGFDRVGVASIDLSADEAHFRDWLAQGFNGDMDYWPADAADPAAVLADGRLAYVSRYALGRDYHKLMRTRLQRLCDRVAAATGPFGYRVFADSAPVLEKALARNAGLGWIGKHTNLIDSAAGSYFFIGEIYLDLELPGDSGASAHCGSCSACLPACPTGAIVAPYRLDARRCISYLTIELKGSIPLEFRRAIGNRIYGCDDCQLVCPWNKFARPSREPGFAVRHGLDEAELAALFSWSEAEFVHKTQGSAIRRLGYERWLRNLAVALGNAPSSDAVRNALRARREHPAALVREHVGWALEEHAGRGSDASRSVGL
jgi:epoxyqueuosine reductase